MRWLTRLVSRDVRALWTLLDAEKGGHRAAHRRIGVLAAEVLAQCRALDVADEMLTEETGRSDRHRLAWLSASRRAERRSNEIQDLERQIAAVRERLCEEQNSWADTRDALKVALFAAQREAAAVHVPPLSGAALELQDRAALYRLEEENALLRFERDQLLAKYEGVPSP